MRRAVTIGIVYCLAGGCVKPYTPKVNSPATGYLVVEGNINNGAVPTQIILSRSEALSDTATEIFENNASVVLEGSDGTMFTASGNGGIYQFDSLALDPAKTYRLDIHTADGSEYQSDYVPVIPNPPIDSVNALQKTDGVHFFINAHNPAGDTRYYQWSYAETWEYTAAENSELEFDAATDSVVDRPPADQIYNCWKQDSSTTLILFSTTKLAQDLVYEFPLITIPEGDWRLSVEYSLAVHQYGLSEGAYNYLREMQASTENLGSIFDPLPTGLKGNIHCLNQPSQTVVGYVNVSSEQSVRIFTNRPSYWPYINVCTEAIDTIPDIKPWYTWYYSLVPPNPPDPSIPQPKGLYIPLYNVGFDLGWGSNLLECADCRYQGGTTTEPPFWK
jgi:hypothetical protein